MQDRNPQPETVEDVARRRKRMSRISEQRWNQLQREFRRAVCAEYPNPGRRDCPGAEAMRDLAERLVLREDLQRDQRWKHAMQCGPCFEEYIVLRDTCLAASKTDSLQQCG